MNTAMESTRSALVQKLTYLGSRAASAYSTSATTLGKERVRQFISSSYPVGQPAQRSLSDRTVELLRSELRIALKILPNLRGEVAFLQYLQDLENALAAFERGGQNQADERFLRLAVALASARSVLQANVVSLGSWLAISSADTATDKQRYIAAPKRFISSPVSLSRDCEADPEELAMWSDVDDFTAL